MGMGLILDFLFKLFGKTRMGLKINKMLFYGIQYLYKGV